MRIAIPSAFLLTLASAVARADGDPATAEALFRQGRAAAESGNYATACPKFEESHRLDPAPGTLLNLADCEENRGQLARAWQHFRKLYDELPATDERKSIADARAHALERRLPKLRIVLVSNSPASVVRDDIALGRASLGTSLPVDPGHHLIVVSAAGRRDQRYEVSVVEGEDREVSVTAGEPLPDAIPPVVVTTLPPGPAFQPPPFQEKKSDGSTQRTVAFILGGVGVASVVTGAVFGVVALSRSANAACKGNVCANQDAVNQFSSAQSFAVATDVAIGVGVALIGTAVVMALTAPHTDARSTPAWIAGRF